MKLAENLSSVAGVDEAGRGCLAGPVVAAAVIFPDGYSLSGLSDSKALSAVKRKILEERIKSVCLSWSLGIAWPEEIDRINILQATLAAMLRAVSKLKIKPGKVLIDGNQSPPLKIPHKCIVKGDMLVQTISAASIIAKTFRDDLMIRLDRIYPEYDFKNHKGYATKAHIQALHQFGPCRLHRFSFKPVRVQKKVFRKCLPGI